MRYIFPLFDKNNEYLGCVELSIRLNDMINNLNHTLKTDIAYLAKKSSIDNTLSKDNKKYFEQHLFFKDYYYDTRTKLDIGITRHQLKHNNNEFKFDVKKRLKSNVDSFSIYDHKVKDAVTFIVIRNIKNNIQALYVAHQEAKSIEIFKNDFYFKVSISTFVIILILFLLYRQYISNIYFQNIAFEEKSRFQLAIEGSSDGLWDWDLKTNEIFYSPRWKYMIGYKDYEIKNHFSEWTSRIPYKDRKNAKGKLRDHINGKTDIFECVYRLLHKNGNWVWILNRGKAQFDSNNKPIRMVGFQTDITELKKLQNDLANQVVKQFEDIKEKDKLIHIQYRQAIIGEMMENITHQYRQPLSVILLLTSSLESIFQVQNTASINKNEILDMLDQIITNTNYLNNTISDFSSFNNTNNHSDILLISKVLNMTLNIFKFNSRKYKININLNIYSDFEVSGNIGYLNQVLITILQNANDNFIEQHIENREVFISTKTINNQNILTIEDNGGGISDDILPKIFDPYFTTKFKSAGTGIGLYMSYKIIEKFNASLEASNTNRGAIFTIKFNSPS